MGPCLAFAGTDLDKPQCTRVNGLIGSIMGRRLTDSQMIQGVKKSGMRDPQVFN